MDPLTIARLLAAGRTAIGFVALVKPKAAGRLFLGELVDAPGGDAACRTIAARDLALGLGLLVADRRKRPLRGWIEAGVLADALDCATGLFFGRGLPFTGRVGAIVAGGAFAWAGVVAAGGIHDAPEPLPDYVAVSD
jgi:hypothetical protein